MISGRFVELIQDDWGTALTEDVPAGATVLPVGDTVDFLDDRGVLQIGDDAYSWSATDDDSITLEVPLAVGYPEATSVAPIGGQGHAQTRWRAMVLLDDDELPTPVAVPWTLVPYVTDLATNTPVEVQLVGRRWRLADVPGLQPRLDGGAIDPGTVPDRPSDGVPPAASPTPTVSGGIGSLHVRWAESENADSVWYRIYISTTTPVPIGAASLLGEFAGSYAYFDRLPTGDPLTPGQQYHLVMIAFDQDGSAPPGGEATGTPTQAFDPQDILDLEASLDALNTTVDGLENSLSETDLIATSALNSANGKNKVIYSTAAPSQTSGFIDGDTWFRKANDATGNIIAQWEFLNGAWVSKTLRHEVIASIDAGKITVGTLNADRIAANSLHAAKIVSYSITALQIGSDQIRANHIDAGAIQAGHIQAGAIDGMTITGALVRTSSGTARVQLQQNDGLSAYNGSGDKIVHISSVDGVATVKRLRTGPSGRRVEVTDSAYATDAGGTAAVQFYDAGGTQVADITSVDSGASSYLQIRGGAAGRGNDRPLRLYGSAIELLGSSVRIGGVGGVPTSTVKGLRFGRFSGNTDGNGEVFVSIPGVVSGPAPDYVLLTADTSHPRHYYVLGRSGGVAGGFSVLIRDSDHNPLSSGTSVAFFWQAIYS